MKTVEYEPFGDEWAKEMNKFSKSELIQLLKKQLKEKPKWISVSESGLPESKTDCFFYSVDLRNPCDMVSGVYFPDERVFMCAGTKWVNVTHWMPLPTKP